MSAAEAIAPEPSVDEVRQSLSVTDKGKTANTIDNCRIVFCCDPLLRDAIRLNLLTDRVDIVQDLGWRRNTSALTDTDVKYLLLYFEQNYELTSEKKITAALSIVANENCYHPIQDVLNSLVWDGTPRIRSCLHHFLGADESDYVEEMLKHFLLGAIRRVFRPGSKYEEMLCLVGGQGAGKSTFFRLLAIRDEWFSDDLKKLDDDRVFQKLQGHWIIEMSEMLATSSAKSIEEIRSFISRQKETYRTPYESQPKDRLRQCVFGGSSNTLDFLPLDRAGNRRFLPIMIYPENAEVHILEDEDASRAYLLQVWAEAMSIYHSGKYSMKFSKSIQRQLVEVQKDFMPEDTEAGQIQGFLEHYTGNMVCSKQLFKEALGHTFDEPKRWQLHNINEIMNTVVTGWKPFSNPRMFAGYGRQKGWERDTSGNELTGNESGFVELSEEEWAVVYSAVEKAVDALVDFRKQEGAALEKKFREKIANISHLLETIAPYEKERVAKVKERITDALEKTLSVDYDKNRLEQELIYYIEKLDVNEEKQRLGNHLKYFINTLETGTGQGKKLGFIAQEMGREINTLGSKSNHAEMQKIVVQMKDELEQIKEQVLNVM